MSAQHVIADTFSYGYKLVEAGVSGLRAGEQLHNRETTDRVVNSAREALKPAAAVAAITYLASRRSRPSARLWRSVAFSGITLCASFAWRNRDLTSHLLDGAAREINRVRDQHWLQTHPIDYA